MKEVEEELKKRKGRPARAIKAHREHQAAARKFIDESKGSFVIVKVTDDGSETMIAISDRADKGFKLAQATSRAAKDILEAILDDNNEVKEN